MNTTKGTDPMLLHLDPRRLGYRGPLGTYPDLDHAPEVLDAAGITWRERERDAALTIGDTDRVAWLDAIDAPAVFAHSRMAADHRNPDKWRQANPVNCWAMMLDDALREARRAVDNARRTPTAPERDPARYREFRDAGRAVLAHLPAGWPRPDRVVARTRFTYQGITYLPGSEIDPSTWPDLDLYRLIKQRRAQPRPAAPRPRTKGTR